MHKISFLKKVSFSLIVAIFIFFCIEVSSAFLNDIELPYKDTVAEHGGGYIVKDKELFWRLRPCKKYNSLGFRDEEFRVQKRKGTYRIICMGDSITYGWPVRKDNTYPKMLGKMLSEKYPHQKFETINAGVPGYTSYQGMKWLENNIIKYQPDLLVVYYGVNDKGYNINNLSDKQQKMSSQWILDIANFLNKFQTCRLINRIVINYKFLSCRDNQNSERRVSSQDYRNNLSEIQKICEENNAKALFIVKPALYCPRERSVSTYCPIEYEPPEDTVKFNIYEIFKSNEKDAHKLFVDDTGPLNFHLTWEGQNLLAREVAKYLIENNLLQLNQG